MGQQQIILIVLGTIIVGIAIAVGITMVQANSISTNRDAMMNDINNLVGAAQAYYTKPGFLGGGNRSFIGYTIPFRMRKTENGAYTLTPTSMNTIVVTAISSENSGEIFGKIDVFHSELYGISYSGAFSEDGDD